MDAFDTDVLIYAAAPGHPLGTGVLALFPEEPPNDAGIFAGVGSQLLARDGIYVPTGARNTARATALTTRSRPPLRCSPGSICALSTRRSPRLPWPSVPRTG
jgi:hypothetical protein